MSKTPGVTYLDTLDAKTLALVTAAVSGYSTDDAGVVYRLIKRDGNVRHMQLFNRMYGVQLEWEHEDLTTKERRTMPVDVLSLFSTLVRGEKSAQSFSAVLPLEQINIMAKYGGSDRKHTLEYPLIIDKRTMSLFADGSGEHVWSFARLGYAGDPIVNGACGGIVYIEFRPSRLNERLIGKRNPKSRFEVLNIVDPEDLDRIFLTLFSATKQLQNMSAEEMAHAAEQAELAVGGHVVEDDMVVDNENDGDKKSVIL